MSTYGYANGSPLVYSDPEGMFAALVLRFAMRYALPQAGFRLGATHAVKRVTPRLIRSDIKRMVRQPTTKATCPQNVVQIEKLKASLLAQEVRASLRGGTALSKSDAYHRSASFLSQRQMAAGRAFTFRGGDGVQRNLLQTNGAMNG